MLFFNQLNGPHLLEATLNERGLKNVAHFILRYIHMLSLSLSLKYDKFDTESLKIYAFVCLHSNWLCVRYTIYDMPFERADPNGFYFSFYSKKATHSKLFSVSSIQYQNLVRFILRCYNWYFGDPSNIVAYILFIRVYMLYVICWMLNVQHNIFSKFHRIWDLYFYAIRLFGSIFNACNTYFPTFDVDACERTTDNITIYVTFVRGTCVCGWKNG